MKKENDISGYSIYSKWLCIIKPFNSSNVNDILISHKYNENMKCETND